MTTFVPLSAGVDGALAAFAASTPAGDAVKRTTGTLILEFRNTAGSAVTVSLVPTRSAGKVSGAGRVQIPTRTLVIPAGQDAAFKFDPDEISAYINSAGLIPITYQNGNAGLLLRAFQL